MNKLDITKTAVKFLERLPPKQFRQIVRTIFKLRELSEPHDSKQLVGYREYRRVDIGEYRTIYRIGDDIVKICVIGKRNDSEIYRRFKRSQ